MEQNQNITEINTTSGLYTVVSNNTRMNMKQSFYYKSENFVVLIEKVLGIPNSNYTTSNAIFNSVNNILYKYNLENTLSVKNASYEGTNISFDIESNNNITKDVFFDNLSKFVNILNEK